MEVAPNPRYSGGSYSCRRLIYISYASAKTCNGDDSTAQGNRKGWGHTNELKYYKHKVQPTLNNTLGPTGLYELFLVDVHMENETSDVQPKCQGPRQLHFLSSPFLMTSTTKNMRPNGRGEGRY